MVHRETQKVKVLRANQKNAKFRYGGPLKLKLLGPAFAKAWKFKKPDILNLEDGKPLEGPRTLALLGGPFDLVSLLSIP